MLINDDCRYLMATRMDDDEDEYGDERDEDADVDDALVVLDDDIVQGVVVESVVV